MAVLTGFGTGLAALRRAPVVGLLVFLVMLAVIGWFRAGSGPSSRPSESAAHAAVLSDPEAREHLARLGFDRVVTTPLDGETTRVSFFNGRRVVLEAAVPGSRAVVAVKRYEDGYVRLGSQVGQGAGVLAAMLAVFALATLRLPLRRLENLDVLALASFVVPVVLLNERYLEWSVVAACVPLAYLMARCAAVALGGGAPRAAQGGFVFERLPRGLRLSALAGATATFALLTVPGGLVSDVAYASMAGATKLLDGTLPYGNLALGDLVHGDTYPLIAYIAYVPAALLAPVRDGFDNLDGALYVAAAFTLLAAALLGVAVRRAGGDGTRAALAMLAFPPVMIAASSGSNDVVAAALVAAALAAGSTAVLTAAGWVKLAPLALVPVWIAAARDRGHAFFEAVIVTAGVAAMVLVLGGVAGFGDMLNALSFQSERGSLLSPWTLLGAEGMQIVFQAAVVACIAGVSVRVWTDRALASDPRRMAALGAAILLAVQLAANHWSYTYLAWVFPLLAVALLSGLKPSRSPSA